jgi:hypothetical protein
MKQKRQLRINAKQNLKKACKTRWLSFDASIQAVWEDYMPVVQTLNAISESDVTAYRSSLNRTEIKIALLENFTYSC